MRTVDPRWLPGDGALARVGGRWQTWIRRGLSPSRLSFAVAHELAEFLLRETPLENEHAANYMGAAIVAPRPAKLPHMPPPSHLGNPSPGVG